jgi:orotidine-5'-phosphate decarboxylase
LGFGSLTPLFDTAHTHGAGVFVVTLTSNPEGAEVQQAQTGPGRSVAATLLAQIAERNRGASPLGDVGAVVAANLPGVEEDLAFNGPILAPGLGAQGGTVADLPRLFGPALPNVLASTSRDVLAAGPGKGCLREKAARVSAELVAARASEAHTRAARVR